MMFTKNQLYQVATLLPLCQGGVHKKEDIMDTAERDYLNTAHSDFRRTTESGACAGRKSEEWAVQASYDQGLLARRQTGYYEIAPEGRHFLEDCATIISEAVDGGEQADAEGLLSAGAIHLLRAIYAENRDSILERQAEELWARLSAQ